MIPGLAAIPMLAKLLPAEAEPQHDEPTFDETLGDVHVEFDEGEVVYVWVPRHVTDGAFDGAVVSSTTWSHATSYDSEVGDNDAWTRALRAVSPPVLGRPA